MRQWRIDYTCNYGKEAFVLTVKSVEHTGHTLPPITRLHTADDVTTEMWEYLRRVGPIGLTVYQLRKVDTATDTSTPSTRAAP